MASRISGPLRQRSQTVTLGAWRVELELRPGHPDPPGESARAALAERGLALAAAVRSGRGFLLPAGLPRSAVERIVAVALADPVAEAARVLEPGAVPPHGERILVVRRHPGVADPEGQSALRALGLLRVQLPEAAAIETYRTYRVEGPVDGPALLRAGSRALANTTIETATLGDEPLLPREVPAARPAGRTEVPLRQLDGAGLAALSQARGLSLSEEEMRAIQAHFAAAGREPTDVELETLAQTWSEHCKHKTLAGPVRLVERDAAGRLLRERHFQNLLRETVFAATERLAPPWCWSVFRDNAGVVALTDDVGIAVKVETHNHPSALEPYGGAGTGIGGVIRDILGTGRGARPFANLDVFCVGPAGADAAGLPPGALHPDRVLAGVVAGVRDYGNRMGIPTVAGTLVRHEGYSANPLVFCGCLGEIPRWAVSKEVRPGDAIVVIGGRTGRDGIHGATFSSELLHEKSETVDATAVQIGDPITEKKVLDVLLQARDRGLYRAVTDCGAGGLSSAVGEMAAAPGRAGGAEVELSLPPVKYPGLTYAEIWISEAQERMVLAVPPERLRELLALCAAEEVEATAIGSFTDGGRLVLRWRGQVVGDLDLDFLHNGLPRLERMAEAVRAELPAAVWPAADPGDLLLRALAHPSVASKEWILRQYDHEVQGGTVLKPYGGPAQRAPADATVLQPRLDLPQGVAIGCGIAPQIGALDAYAGAACAVDEAVRNVVAAGGDPHRLALLDNFCWGDCRKPDRLGSLARAAEACHDAALAYGAPFISGKDSLNNEYRTGTEERSIPPTLLCTAVAPLADAGCAISTFLKEPGNAVVLVGLTGPEGGGSVAAELLGLPPARPPLPDFEHAPALLSALHEAQRRGLVASCHDLAEGGLAVAAAEMVLGSRLGMRLEVSRVPATGLPPPEAPAGLVARLFSETPTRFLAEVPRRRLEELAALLRAIPWAPVGEVDAAAVLVLLCNGRPLGSFEAARLAEANGASGERPGAAGSGP